LSGSEEVGGGICAGADGERKRDACQQEFHAMKLVNAELHCGDLSG
jgi:hypothetical protein